MEKHLRAAIAELIGTFFLTFIGAGAICTDAVATRTLGTAGAGQLGIALAHGLALAVAVTATLNLSGGHINPAVTITMWVYKRIETDRAILYIVAQVVGAVIAGGLIVLFFQGSGAFGPASEVGFGTPHVKTRLFKEAGGFQVQAWAVAIEAVLTFLLVFAVFGTAVDPRAPKVGGFAIGLTLAADILMGGPLTGAAMNPARAFGPAIWQGGIMGWDHISDQLVYWIGPIVGGVLAGGIYTSYLMPPEEPKA